MQFRHCLYLLKNRSKKKFECPICRYYGPFKDIAVPSGLRKHAKCLECGALERHRIQFCVVEDILKKIDVSSLKMLHFAPETFFKDLFSKQFNEYETADILMDDVDHHVDLQNLPFNNHTYDVIFASHVLEHIADDDKAISEIRRILKPEGIAILPVPIVAENTIEYPEPNPNETYHVRAPGLDYFKRYEKYFSKVKCYNSKNYPEKYQLYIYEDRSNYPNMESPMRPPMKGEKHKDFVPVCFV